MSRVEELADREEKLSLHTARRQEAEQKHIAQQARYDSLPALTDAIRQDVADARAYLAAHAAQRRQTTRDRI